MTNANSEVYLRRVLRVIFSGCMCVALLAIHPRLGAAEGPYSAIFRSQKVVSGKELREIDKGADDVFLDGTKLFDRNDPVRVIRDTTLSNSARGPFVQMTNGDVLPGRVTEFASSGNEAGLPPHLIVELTHDPQTIQTKKQRIRVLAEAVVRIVPEGQRPAPFYPGFIQLNDGRQLRAESVRWTSTGLKALTRDGILSARFDQLRSFDLPGKDVVAGVVSDAKWQFIYPDDFLLRIHTTNGSQLTFPRRMVTRDVEQVRRHRRRSQTKQVEQIAVQPAWALKAIHVPRDSIVFRTYRRFSEVPLSLLPVVAHHANSGLHYWPWQKNQSVKGSTLRSGDVAVDLGVGMHSYCELTFQLPDSASKFSSLVGLDYDVGKGGCVRCRLHAGSPKEKVLWDSGFLRGEDSAKPVGPLSLSGATQLTLVTDFGHKGRPAGADPYDLRDQVAWLMPAVEIDTSKLVRLRDLQVWLPKLDGWTVSEETFKRLKLVPVWNRDAGRWEISMRLDKDGQSSFRISRRLRVTPQNAWLPIEVRRDGSNRARGHVVRVEVNGEPHGSTMNGDLKTQHAYKSADSRVWMLGEYLGQEIKLDVVVESLAKWSTGVIWDTVAPRPIITGLPERDSPVTPHVSLLSLKPVKHNLKGKPIFEPGKLTSGKPLVVRSIPFDRGFGVPVGTELTYELEPEWTRFVAVIGLADGWKGAGPFEILLDGQPHWSSEVPSFGRINPAAQIDVPIPPGHKTISLVVRGSESYGAWGDAGFMR